MTTGACALCVAAMSSVGLTPNVPVALGPYTVVLVGLSSGLLALAYLAAGVGLVGPLASRLVRGGAGAGSSSNRAYLQVGLGVGLMFWLSHLLGCFGLLSGAKGQYVAIGVMVVGLTMLTAQCVKAFHAKARLPSVPPVVALCAPAIGVLLVAACNPPGSLWTSEARGYDALSYHLPLAMEWTAGPRLEPLAHNVYSFLPSYVEAGFMHLDALLGGGAGERANGGLVSGEGFGLLSCQWLHAWCTLIAGVIVARVALVAARWAGAGDAAARVGAGIAGAVMIATPWAVVVGSLAYNECAVNVLFATALLGCVDAGLSPWARGLIAGGALGLATGCKPTAAFLCGPTVAFVMLGFSRWREVPVLSGAAVLAGVIAFAPPLLRNWAASGNPIFPAGTAVFGTAHWTQEQVDRFKTAHAPNMSVGDALGQLVSTTPATGTVDAEPRGAMHSQWFGLFPCAAVGLLVTMGLGPARRLPALLVLGAGLSIVWWAVGSNVQSRFLLPMLVSGSLLVGLAAAGAWRRGSERPPVWGWLVIVAMSAVPLVQAVQTVRVFLEQNRAQDGQLFANALLIGGPEAMTGMILTGALAQMDPAKQHEFLADQGDRAWVNLGLLPDDVVLLVGEARSAYYLRRTVYASTWDRSILTAAMLGTPDDPAAWATSLRTAGITHVLVNPSELERLRTSGWCDPALTQERLTRFLSTQCELLQAAPGDGPRLYRLVDGQGGPARRPGHALAQPDAQRGTPGGAA